MTNQPKYTPGPWRLYFIGPASTPDWYIESDEQGIVRIPDNPALRERQKANARLIAAAPEMLEALEGLSRWVAKGIENGAFDNTVGNAVADYNRANAIIKKAKGE